MNLAVGHCLGKRQIAIGSPALSPAGWSVVGVLALLACATGRVTAQPVRGHLRLPPTRGATVLSTYIDAQAHYIVAMGDYLESAAIARRHRAAALDKELDNSIKWVDTYFKRRELNRAYRLKKNPRYLDKVEKRQKVTRRRVAELPLEVLKGDVTDELNWLLDKLATASLAYEAIYSSDDRYVDSASDQVLSPEDIRHIVLTDGGRKYGQKLTFRASDAKVLKTRWPVVFRAPDFQTATTDFEKTIDKGLNEIRTEHQLSYQTWTEMREAVTALGVELEQKYPRKYLMEAPILEFHMYHKGKQFLQTQELAILRAMSTNQTEAFDGSNRFTGDSVFDLTRHMCLRGLQYSKPEPGDEPTYKKLLIAMRQIYLNFYPENSAHW